MGQYLKQMHTEGTAYQPLGHWAGLQGGLDPLLWLVFITGGFTNTPAMRPAIAFIPPSVPQAASMALLHRQSAVAVLAAESICASAGAATGTDCMHNATDASPLHSLPNLLKSSPEGALQQVRCHSPLHWVCRGLGLETQSVVFPDS